MDKLIVTKLDGRSGEMSHPRLLLMNRLQKLNILDYQTYLYALLELYEFYRQNIDTKKLLVDGVILKPGEILPIINSPFYINGGFLIWLLYFEIGHDHSLWKDFKYKVQFEYFKTLDIDIRAKLYPHEGTERWRKCDTLMNDLTRCLYINESNGNERLGRVYNAIDAVLKPEAYPVDSQYRNDNNSVFLNQYKYRVYSQGIATFSNCKVNLDFQINALDRGLAEEHIIDMDLGSWTRTGLNQIYNFTNTQVFVQGSFLYEEVAAQFLKTLEMKHEPYSSFTDINQLNKVLLNEPSNWIKYMQGFYRAQMVIHLFKKLKDQSPLPQIFSIFNAQNIELLAVIKDRFLTTVVNVYINADTSIRLANLISFLENGDPESQVHVDVLNEWFDIQTDYFQTQMIILESETQE